MSAKTHKQSGGGRKTAVKPRILYFDVLRALAPILVVIVHTACRVADRANYFDSRTTNMFVLNVVCQICIPIFVMISGALFLDPRRKFELKMHLRKYVLRIAIIYAVWSIIYAVLGYIFAEQGLSAEQRLGRFFGELFGLHHYHLWFLLMLLMMYLLVPCLRKIAESRALTEYFLILGIVFCFALPGLGESFSLLRAQHVGGNAAALGALNGAKDLFYYLSGKLGLKFVIYFVLGYYLHRYDIGKVWRRILYVLGVFGLIYAILTGLWHMRLISSDIGAETQNINLGILVYGAGVFVLFKQLFKRAKSLPRPLRFMAKHSFGVYLVHAALVDYILYRIIEAGSQPVWILLPCSVLIYATSLIISWALSKLPIIKKVIQ